MGIQATPALRKASGNYSMADLIPYHDRDGFIWFDGKLVPWRSATTHVLTHSLHYGLGVFEGLRAYNTVERGTGRTMSGGLDSNAMQKPKAASSARLPASMIGPLRSARHGRPPW